MCRQKFIGAFAPLGMAEMTSRPKALMATIQHWDSPFRVGSHHIARLLLDDGWEVGFIPAPVTPMHHLLPRSADLSVRFANSRQGGGRAWDGALWHYVPHALLAPDNRALLSHPWLLDNWWRLSVPDLLAKVRAQGFGAVDLLYLDTPYQPFWLGSVAHRRSIYRMTDYTGGFPGARPSVVAAEQRLCRGVDRVAVTASTLLDEVRALGATEVVHWPNGIRFDQFGGPPMDKPPEYVGLQSPIAVYVGAMESWLDWDTLQEAIERLPQIHFVLIGPSERARGRLPMRPNLMLLGPRAHEELVPYLQHAHIGLIPFDTTRHDPLIRHVHPLKLYEYLACGLTVIASAWLELERLGGPAWLYHDREECIRLLERALTTPADADEGRAWARRADWKIRSREFLLWAKAGSGDFRGTGKGGAR